MQSPCTQKVSVVNDRRRVCQSPSMDSKKRRLCNGPTAKSFGVKTRSLEAWARRYVSFVLAAVFRRRAAWNAYFVLFQVQQLLTRHQQMLDYILFIWHAQPIFVGHKRKIEPLPTGRSRVEHSRGILNSTASFWSFRDRYAAQNVSLFIVNVAHSHGSWWTQIQWNLPQKDGVELSIPEEYSTRLPLFYHSRQISAQ